MVNILIGYSDHTIGIATPIAAVAMGAKIIEKHITIDRKMKGTDQAGSLAIDGIERMVTRYSKSGNVNWELKNYLFAMM